MTHLHSLLKLRDDLIAKHKNLVDELDLAIDKKAIDVKMAEINNPTVVEYKSDLHNIVQHYARLQDENHKIAEEIAQLIDKINAEVKAQAAEKFKATEFNKEFGLLEPAYPWVQPYLIDLIKVRAHQYNDWRYPGLQLYPQDKSWVDCMVGCDPLYLVSDTLETLEQITATYPELYQARLRLYKFNQWESLPQGQVGFALLWDYLEYCTPEAMRHYLSKIAEVLRPGGVLMFSYNNCDLKESMLLAERGTLNYNHRDLVEQIITELGYEVLKFEDAETGNDQYPWISWAEIKRPGELNTVKAHQVLGKIVPKIY